MVPLDFTNVSELPDSHAWNLDPFFSDDQTLPIIDLAKPDINAVRDACEKWGGFQVINHGIPSSLLHETEFQTRRLFSLLLERKLTVSRSPEGFRGYGSVRISSFFDKQMWSEGFSIMGSPLEHATKLWPQHHTNFCKVMDQCQAQMKTLCEKLLTIMLSSLGLSLTHEEEDLKWFDPKNGCNRTTSLLQLNSYPVCPDPDRAMGLAPHTDSSLLTLLYQGSINGFQVHRCGAGWTAVEPVEGALVVNLGDLMQIISNGKFKSVLHHAVVNDKQHRVSAAFFYGPPKDAKVSPLRKLIDFDHPMLYRPVTWKEFLQIKGKHFNQSLKLIRL